MDKELLDKGELKIKLEGTKVVLTLDTSAVDVTVALEGDYLLDKLADVIPGEIDDSIIAILKGALKA